MWEGRRVLLLLSHTQHTIFQKWCHITARRGIWNYLPTNSCYFVHLRSSFSTAVPCSPIQRILLALSQRISVKLTSRLHIVLQWRMYGALPTFMATRIQFYLLMSWRFRIIEATSNTLTSKATPMYWELLSLASSFRGWFHPYMVLSHFAMKEYGNTLTELAHMHRMWGGWRPCQQ